MTRKILITESDVDIKLLVSSLLKKHYQISFLNDAKLLLEGSFEKPDLFILNSHLPDHSILEVCKHLKSHADTREIPILIISASEDIDSLMEECPGDDFIRKPFSGGELLEKVHSAINTKITSR
ncbi:DNA-binding response OmpR family regulator [Chitinophaga sp. W2I13]|uniref:response regulator n=1 Tax=unclassified Chitinophaga TaxID=2619133 RepID=UPI003D1BD8E0